VDPITAGAQIVNAIQTLASRELFPLESAVISVATFQAGTAHNVIPGEAVLSGTIRTFTPQIQDQILERLDELATGIGEAMRCQVDITVSDTSPAVVNNPEIAEVVRGAAREIFPDHDLDSRYRTMVSEDMALMMQNIPSCYCLVGSGNPVLNLTGKHHQAIFNFDERAMIHGVSLLCGAVDSFLRG
jgi:amidohydrolase